MLFSGRIDTPIGTITVLCGDAAVRFVLLPGDTAHGAQGDRIIEQPDHPVVRSALDQLAEYFAGARRTFDLPLEPRGTDFQRATWAALGSIPYATTVSYAEQARRVGRPRATRAVGAANGRNPLPIVVPCHRVIGSDGSLTGFGGGLGAKEWLLGHERDVLAGSAR